MAYRQKISKDTKISIPGGIPTLSKVISVIKQQINHEQFDFYELEPFEVTKVLLDLQDLPKLTDGVPDYSYYGAIEGVFIINKRDVKAYFGRDTLKMMLEQPFDILGLNGKYDISVNVKGGCLSGQAGAVRLGISRCLEKINPDYRPLLKEAGMLTRDSREVERKKYG